MVIGLEVSLIRKVTESGEGGLFTLVSVLTKWIFIHLVKTETEHLRFALRLSNSIFYSKWVSMFTDGFVFILGS